MSPHLNKKIACWLFFCAGTIFLMALIGVITRLTESGLSIVEWKPVTGALPPLNDHDWNHAFTLYKSSPQYKKVNLGMNLDSFKRIYFWEWLHRLWGRLIGLFYFIPLVWFWYKKQIPVVAQKSLLGILALGFLQGLMGWLMVKSGLVDQPTVSHYRLALHLALAFIVFCCLFRMALAFHHLRDPAADLCRKLRKFIQMITALAGLTMAWGAFVAGLRAGKIYNTFPLMGTHLWPGEIFDLSPTWINFFENHATVQFVHRLLAVLTISTIVLLIWKSFSSPCPIRLRRLFIALGGMVFVQAGLGIATLLTQVNITLATLHQAGAMATLAILMALLYEIPRKV